MTTLYSFYDEEAEMLCAVPIPQELNKCYVPPETGYLNF